MSCYHCGCAQALHRNSRDECEACSCIKFLGPDGEPLPDVPDDPENLDTLVKFVRADVRNGDRLAICHRIPGITAITQTYRYASAPGPSEHGIHVAREVDGETRRLEWDDILECRRLDSPAPADRPANLDAPETFKKAGILPGAKLHLHVTDIDGPHTTDEAVFVRLFQACGREIGMIVRLGDKDIDLVWDDIIECWPVTAEGAKKPANLDTAHAFFGARIAPGTRLHLAVVGNHVTDEATYVRPFERPGPRSGFWDGWPEGIVVRLIGREVDLPWGDIIECWPVPGEIDPRYADGQAPDDAPRDANLDFEEKFIAANVPEGARLALVIRFHHPADGKAGETPLLGRLQYRSKSGLWIFDPNGKRLHVRWSDIASCRLVDAETDMRPPMEGR